MTKAPPGQLTFHTEAEQFLFNRDCLFVLVFLLIFLQRSRPGTSQLVGWECVSLWILVLNLPVLCSHLFSFYTCGGLPSTFYPVLTALIEVTCETTYLF